MAAYWNIKVDILNIISNEYAISMKVVHFVEAKNFALWIISTGSHMKLEPMYCSSMERKMKCKTTTDTVVHGHTGGHTAWEQPRKWPQLPVRALFWCHFFP